MSCPGVTLASKCALHHECVCGQGNEKDICTAELRKKQVENFDLDLEDIADSLYDVMRVCEMKPWELRSARLYIKRYFVHFDEIRLRMDRVPHKRFCKEDFMHNMAREVGMSRMDAQLAYSIVKRAFAAYYYGTGLEGRRLRSRMDHMKHRQECLWMHAAKRTAEVYAAYAGLMYSEQMQYQMRIESIYRGLHVVLESRLIYDDDIICPSDPKNQHMVEKEGTDLDSVVTTEVLFLKESLLVTGPESRASVVLEKVDINFDIDSMKHSFISDTVSKASSNRSSKFHKISSKHSAKLSSRQSSKKVSKWTSRLKKQCSCPHLPRIEEFMTEAPQITAECSQGPYICRWLPYEEDFTEHHVPLPPMETICPSCVTDDRPCDPECTCTCEVCRCEPAYGESVEEEHKANLSTSGVEDHDTDFCFLAPFRDTPRVDNVRNEEGEEENFETDEEEQYYKCVCVCDYKQRAYPHLFTYLAPIKESEPELESEPEPKPSNKQMQANEQPSEKLDEATEPPKPPLNVSASTYRCWTQPTLPNDDSNQFLDLPLIYLLSAEQKKPAISVDVSVKNQHQGTTQARRTTEVPAKSPAKPPATASKATPRKSPVPVKRATRTSKVAVAAAAPEKPKQPQASGRTDTRNEPELTKEDILGIIGF